MLDLMVGPYVGEAFVVASEFVVVVIEVESAAVVVVAATSTKGHGWKAQPFLGSRFLNVPSAHSRMSMEQFIATSAGGASGVDVVITGR